MSILFLLTHCKAGGAAGTSVDLLFYPLDTVKTRLQSAQGFFNAGGFRGIYKGVGSVVIGSAPGGENSTLRFKRLLNSNYLHLAAIFFSTYDTLKRTLPQNNAALNHMVSASIAEVVRANVAYQTGRDLSKLRPSGGLLSTSTHGSRQE